MWTLSNEFRDELDKMARECGESERSLIGAYATPRSIVLMSVGERCLRTVWRA